jgi:hypothetical protein
MLRGRKKLIMADLNERQIQILALRTEALDEREVRLDGRVARLEAREREFSVQPPKRDEAYAAQLVQQADALAQQRRDWETMCQAQQKEWDVQQTALTDQVRMVREQQSQLSTQHAQQTALARKQATQGTTLDTRDAQLRALKQGLELTAVRLGTCERDLDRRDREQRTASKAVAKALNHAHDQQTQVAARETVCDTREADCVIREALSEDVGHAHEEQSVQLTHHTRALDTQRTDCDTREDKLLAREAWVVERKAHYLKWAEELELRDLKSNKLLREAKRAALAANLRSELKDELCSTPNVPGKRSRKRSASQGRRSN